MPEPENSKQKNNWMKSPVMRIFLGIAGVVLIIHGVQQMLQGMDGMQGVHSEMKEMAQQSLKSLTKFEKGEFSIQYPSKWERKDTKEPQIFGVKSPQGMATILVAGDAVAPGETSEDYTDALLKLLKQKNPKTTVISREPFDIKGGKANRVVLTQVIDDFTAHQMIVSAVGKDRAYAVILSSPDQVYGDFSPLFTQVSNSIELKAVAATTDPAAPKNATPTTDKAAPKNATPTTPASAEKSPK